jgi:2'-5' RNA ligase
MQRYFIALIPPDDVQAYALEVIHSLSDRYRTSTAKAPPHITLSPPFYWSPADYDRLEAQLVQFGQAHGEIPVQLLGFGAFAPRVLYLNVVRSPELLALQADLTNALEETLGIVDAHKSRPFAPHVTVASRRMTRSIFQQAWAELQPRCVEFSFTATAIVLLAHDGQRWQIQRQFPLQAQHRS